MYTRDLHDNISASTALVSQTIDSDTTTEGATIDTQGFESTEFLFTAGALADGVFSGVVMEADEVDGGGSLIDPTEVDPDDLFGEPPVLQNDAGDDSGTTKRVGYNGSKRYLRFDIESTATVDGGIVGAVAVQGCARNAPVV